MKLCQKKNTKEQQKMTFSFRAVKFHLTPLRLSSLGFLTILVPFRFDDPQQPCFLLTFASQGILKCELDVTFENDEVNKNLKTL